MQTLPEGQMTHEERNYIEKIIKENNFKFVVESGTWYGGGSTLSIMKGLIQTNGVLFTYEEELSFFDVARNFYENSIFSKNIKLYNISFLEGLKNLSEETLLKIDLVLLDGGDETPNGFHKLEIDEYIKDYYKSENVQSFIYLEDKLKPNCHLLLHDWSIEIGRGNFIKRYLTDKNFQGFELINIIETSTGLAHLIKK